MILLAPPSCRGPTRTTSSSGGESIPSWMLAPTITRGTLAASESVTSCASEMPSSEKSARAASIAITRPRTGAARGPADVVVVGWHVADPGLALAVEGEGHPHLCALVDAAVELDPVAQRLDQRQPQPLDLESRLRRLRPNSHAVVANHDLELGVLHAEVDLERAVLALVRVHDDVVARLADGGVDVE